MVIPARDEAARIGPCLEALRRDPDVGELIVVDDESRDGTAQLAAAAGARVVQGAPLPSGWVGKPWALQQGLEAASGRWLVTVDADARPRPGLLRSLVAALAEVDLVTVGPRFLCETAGERLLHPSLLCTIVYRLGPVGAEGASPDRLAANGQCMAADRERLAAAGGFARGRANPTDDVALARSLARDGWRVMFADGADVLTVKMHSSAMEVWREWGRSIAMRDVSAPGWLAFDLAVVWLTMGLPPLRLLARRSTVIDRLLLAVRLSLLLPLRRAYEPRGLAYWLSPLADPASALRLTLSTLRRSRTWRGRTYG